MGTTLFIFLVFIVAMATILAVLRLYYIRPKEEMKYMYRQGFADAQREIFQNCINCKEGENYYDLILARVDWERNYKEFIKEMR